MVSASLGNGNKYEIRGKLKNLNESFKTMPTPTYTEEQLTTIMAKLRAMPRVEKQKTYSKQDAIRLISKEIAAMQRNGYTLDQISHTLKGEGLDIATPTLKSYLQRAKPAPKPSPAKPPAPSGAAAVVKQPAETSKPTLLPKPDTDVM